MNDEFPYYISTGTKKNSQVILSAELARVFSVKDDISPPLQEVSSEALYVKMQPNEDEDA